MPAVQSCKETSWLLRHSVPFQSHSRALTFQHRNVVWTKNKGMFLDPIFSKLLGKTSLEREPFCTSSCSHTAQRRGTAELLHLGWILKVRTLPWSHSTSIPACLTPHPVQTCKHTQHRCPLPAQMGQKWARQSTCYFSQLTSRYPWLFQAPRMHLRAAQSRETLGLGNQGSFTQLSPPPGVQLLSQTEVGEVHSGGRADTASRIHLSLINRESPN